jgi:hypothetical protein
LQPLHAGFFASSPRGAARVGASHFPQLNFLPGLLTFTLGKWFMSLILQEIFLRKR